MDHETVSSIPSSGGGDPHGHLHRAKGRSVRNHRRSWRRTVGACVVAALAVVTFTVAPGNGGVAHAENKYICAGWIGWGFVGVGATVTAETAFWAAAGAIDTGLSAYSANRACGWGSVQHVGYRALCVGQHFLYISPLSGKAVYDNRDGACGHSPYELDDVYCKFLHVSDGGDACFWQVLSNLRDYLDFLGQYIHWYWGSPLDGAAGGGGGGSW